MALRSQLVEVSDSPMIWPQRVRAVAVAALATSDPGTRSGLMGAAFAIFGRFAGGVEISQDGVSWMPCVAGMFGPTPRRGRGHRGLHFKRSADSNPGGTIRIAQFDGISEAEGAARNFLGEPAADFDRSYPARNLVTVVTTGGAVSQQTAAMAAGTRVVLVVNDPLSAGDVWVSDTPTRAVVSSTSAIRVPPGGSVTFSPRGASLGYATSGIATVSFIEDIYE